VKEITVRVHNEPTLEEAALTTVHSNDELNYIELAHSAAALLDYAAGKNPDGYEYAMDIIRNIAINNKQTT